MNPARHPSLSSPLLILAAATATITPSVLAQCEGRWIFGPDQGVIGVQGPAAAVTHWDPDGPGPRQPLLVVGGHFYAVGGFDGDGIGLWDGASWSKLDSAPRGIYSLAVFQGDLICAGYFTSTASGVPVNSIARFDGTTWSPLGQGLDGWVYALTVHNNELIAAGTITAHGSSGGGAHILRWDGSSWQALGGGLTGSAYTLAEYQGSLVVGGEFNRAGSLSTSNIARWDGAAWQQFDTGIEGGSAAVRALAASGPDLYAGGDHFGAASGESVQSITHWDGARWHAMGTGMLNSDHNPYASVNALLVNNGYVYAGGDFTYAGGNISPGIARWNGSWSPLPGPQLDYAAANVLALAQHGDGVVVAGSFQHAGWLDASNVALWSDPDWSQLGAGLGYQVYSMTQHRGDVIACGTFLSAGAGAGRGVARWNGREWQPLTPPANASVRAVASYNGALVVGGRFDEIGGINASAVAQWEGEQWSPVGTGLAGGYEQTDCSALGSYHGDLIVAGSFTVAGGVSASNIARWDGAQWHALGSGVPYPDSVRAITVFDDMLIIAGAFDQAGGVPTVGVAAWDGLAWRSFPDSGVAPTSVAVCRGELYIGDEWSPTRIKKWNGLSWEAVPGLMNDGGVFALADYHGDLVAAGILRSQQFAGVQGAARWNGQVWRSLAADGASGASVVLVAHDELVFGGASVTAGGLVSRNWARWSDTGIPWLALQPEPVTIPVGATAALFAASAAGYPDLHYAWRRNGLLVIDGPAGASIGGGNVSGATAPNLTIDGAQTSDSGYYSIDIVGPCGGVTSFAAPVSVGVPLCYVNCDLSSAPPVLNVGDFICFLSRFAAGEPYANCDHSTAAPQLNVLDFICFLNQFATGCP